MYLINNEARVKIEVNGIHFVTGQFKDNFTRFEISNDCLLTLDDMFDEKYDEKTRNLLTNLIEWVSMKIARGLPINYKKYIDVRFDYLTYYISVGENFSDQSIFVEWSPIPNHFLKSIIEWKSKK